MRLKGKEIVFVPNGGGVGKNISGTLRRAKVVSVKKTYPNRIITRQVGHPAAPLYIRVDQMVLEGKTEKMVLCREHLYKPHERSFPARKLAFGPAVLYKIGNSKLETIFGPDWSKWPHLMLKMRFSCHIENAARTEKEYRRFIRGLGATKDDMLKAVEKLYSNGLICKEKPAALSKSSVAGLFEV